jgi:hypothetical protein
MTYRDFCRNVNFYAKCIGLKRGEAKALREARAADYYNANTFALKYLKLNVPEYFTRLVKVWAQELGMM